MHVLGISCYYHDAAASLLRDGVVLAAAEEERFTRVKHDHSFPINAINYCLESQNVRIGDIDYIAFYEKPLLKLERALYQHLQSFPLSYKTFIASMPSWITEKARVAETIQKKLKYKKDVLFVDHHMAHAASSFLLSPFEKSAILTVDGVGEWTTAAYGIGQGAEIRLMKEIRFPHSIGLLYSTITAYLGFSVNNSEYKVMGLSAYGNTDRGTNEYYQKLMGVMDLKEDGSFCFDMRYFKYHYADRMPSDLLCGLLGGPARKPSEPVTKRHEDIAAAVQLVTEEILTRMLLHLHRETSCENVVLSGGVALNSVYNGKILSRTPFTGIWIQPNASDGGTSMGAAAYAYSTLLKKGRRQVLTNAYLGPEYTDGQIRDFLEKNEIAYSKFKNSGELLSHTAREIFENQVIGWFQGRMEWGPRALGARSILANPCNPQAKELLNEKVKHREKFRPFAPVVCAEDAATYFECDAPVPLPTDFMLMVYPVKKKYRSAVPSVVHVDGTGRLQTVRREQHPLYYDLIKEFGKLSSIPMLINTSFNIRGEPIVCTPHDAYQCMMGTGIDSLVMGSYLIRRADNRRDIWDSEKLAFD